MNGGSPPLTYKRFQSVLAKMEAPSEPEETINSEFLEKKKTPIAEDHDDKYGVPTLEELGKNIFKNGIFVQLSRLIKLKFGFLDILAMILVQLGNPSD